MIEVSLRPLALRGNLTPDVMDFYLKITHDPMGQVSYDFAKHQIIDESYQEKAVFAGGCFWCLVEPFETRQGIISVLSGYTGGEVEHPNYDQVSSGTTGHVEAVEIIFDRRMINYEELLAIFWQVTDPTDAFVLSEQFLFVDLSPFMIIFFSFDYPFDYLFINSCILRISLRFLFLLLL